MGVQTQEANKVLDDMKKRVDRLMKSIQLEIEDGDFRIELITRLIAVRELLSDRRDEPSN